MSLQTDISSERKREIIASLKNFSTFNIIAFGISSDAAIFFSKLQQYDISCPMPIYFVDENSQKNSLSIQDTIIPVYESLKISSEDSTIVVVIFDDILQRIQQLRKNLRTIVLHPIANNTVYLFFNGCCYEMSKSSIAKPLERKKAKTLLITHVHNQEYLLPFFIRHYRNMFDECVVIDYASTDKTREIFQSLAPSNWKIVPSQNEYFLAQSCDDEVRAIEQSYPDDVWKYSPTVTELLVFPDMDEFLSNTQENALSMTSYDAIGPNSIPVQENQQLLPQCALVAHPGHPCLYRYIHRNQNGKQLYQIGRHFLTTPSKFISTAYHVKLRCAPWPEIINRKLDYGKRVPGGPAWTTTLIEQERHGCMMRCVGNFFCPSLSSLTAEIINQSRLLHAQFNTSWRCIK